MLRQLTVICALLLWAGCDYSYDAEGKEFPPDVPCASVADCMSHSSTGAKLGECVADCDDGDEACGWTCVQQTQCLSDETTSDEFTIFYKACNGDQSLALLIEEAQREKLVGCLTDDDQQRLIEICATRD